MWAITPLGDGREGVWALVNEEFVHSVFHVTWGNPFRIDSVKSECTFYSLKSTFSPCVRFNLNKTLTVILGWPFTTGIMMKKKIEGDGFKNKERKKVTTDRKRRHINKILFIRVPICISWCPLWTYMSGKAGTPSTQLCAYINQIF